MQTSGGTVSTCLAPDLPSMVKGGLVSGTWDASLCLIDNGRAATVGQIVDLGPWQEFLLRN